MGIGHGKLLLFGEHAVVHGYPALGMGLPIHTEVRIVDGSGTVHRGSHPDPGRLKTPGFSDEDRASLVEALSGVAQSTILTPGIAGSALLERIRTRIACAESVRVQSSVPRGVGLGSSSALCAAVARSLLGDPKDPAEAAGHRAAGETPEHAQHTAWQLAHALEHVYHGTPSGIDTALSVYGGVLAVFPSRNRGEGPPYALPRTRAIDGAEGTVGVLYGHVPRTGGAKAIIARIGEAISAGDSETTAHIEALGRHAGEAIALLSAEGFADEAVRRLGSLADAAHRHLRALSLSAERIERLIEAGRREGALGGKLSGAGGGGAWFLLFPTLDDAKRARSRMTAGFPHESIHCTTIGTPTMAFPKSTL